EPCDPAAADIIRELGARVERHPVEADGDLARTGRRNSRGGVVDDEARRHREGNAEARMQEGVAAHIAFIRRIAVKQTVNAGEEGIAVACAFAGRAELARMALRQLYALRRIGMACKEVQAGVGGAADGTE